MLSRVSICRDSIRVSLGVGGVGSERVLRAQQGRGNPRDKVVTPGKDRARGGQRQECRIWEMGS